MTTDPGEDRSPPGPRADLGVAPDFTLPDQAGGTVTLSAALGRVSTVLVFYRGHWCPYCRRYLGKLQANVERFRERGAVLIGISPEPPTTSAALAAEFGLTFPLLCDVDARVIGAYGVRNAFTGAAPNLPHPAIFVLSADRAIRFRSIDRNFKRRTPVSAILRAVEGVASGDPV